MKVKIWFTPENTTEEIEISGEVYREFDGAHVEDLSYELSEKDTELVSDKMIQIAFEESEERDY